MPLAGAGLTTAAALAGTIDKKDSIPATKLPAMVGSSSFEDFDSIAPPRPAKSMLARIESFFRGIAAKISSFMPSFSPFNREIPLEKQSSKLQELKAKLEMEKAKIGEAAGQLNTIADTSKRKLSNIAEKIDDINNRKRQMQRDHIRRDHTHANHANTSRKTQDQHIGAASRMSHTKATGVEKPFPANGVTLNELIKNIDTINDMMQVNSHAFSGDVVNTIAQSPTLMKHLNTLAEAGWRMDIQREVNMPKAPDDDAGMLQMFDKAMHMPYELMRRDPVQFLDKFATGLMLDASKALGDGTNAPDVSQKHMGDLYKIRDEMAVLKK